MSLTQQQYVLIMNLTKTLPKILQTDEEPSSAPSKSPNSAVPNAASPNTSNVTPTEKSNLDFAFKVPVVRLELFGNKATTKASLQEDSIAAFSINASHVQYQSQTDGSSEANVTVKSIAMSNTRPGDSIYRDLIPEGKRRGNQLYVTPLYSY